MDDELIVTVKKWVLLDNQIRALAKKTQELRSEKKQQNLQMIEIMKRNQIDNFDLKDGQIQYKKTSRKEPLTPSRLLSILTTHPEIAPLQVHNLHEFILQNRKAIETETITRKIHIPKAGI